MMYLLSKKANSGDLYVNLTERHLECHEWGHDVARLFRTKNHATFRHSFS
jgi:hypothetical protein